MSKVKSKISVYKICIGAILVLYAISLFFVVYWGLATSVKSSREFRKNVLWLPEHWEFKNVSTVFENFGWRVMRDGKHYQVGLFDVLYYTIVYAFGGAFVATLVPCCVAYVTAKFDYAPSKFIYTAVIIIMLLPIVGNLPSMLSVLQALNLYDTLIGSLILKAHFLNMYYLVFYATFKGIAKDYAEAAYLDGAGEWRIFLQIMLPLVRTGFMTIMLIFFIEFWNDYQTPLLYLPSHPTLSYAVYKKCILDKGTATSTTPMRMVTCIVMVIPTLTLFLCFKDKMIGNLSMGGVKG